MRRQNRGEQCYQQNRYHDDQAGHCAAVGTEIGPEFTHGVSQNWHCAGRFN